MGGEGLEGAKGVRRVVRTRPNRFQDSEYISPPYGSLQSRLVHFEGKLDRLSWAFDPDYVYEQMNKGHEKIGLPAVLVHGITPTAE